MFRLAEVRFYSGAQYALCSCQHSDAPDAKQRGFLCNTVGRQASEIFCVTWHLLGEVFIELFFV